MCDLKKNGFAGVGTSTILTSGAAATTDDLTADDSASNAGGGGQGDVPGSDDFPSLGLPPGLTERQGYKVGLGFQYVFV